MTRLATPSGARLSAPWQLADDALMSRTPVTIVAGFLGAGKTTLIRRMLAAPEERLAVLVNDFAAINVDAALIESSAPDRIALTNGCVCCTLRTDLLAATLELTEAIPPPERIVVETSGVAEPYGVMEAFLMPEALERVFVDSAICVVDALEFPRLDYASGELAIDQAATCDIVLLNKCDLVGEEDIRSVERVLHGALPAMRIHRTVGAAVPTLVLFGNQHRSLANGTHRHPDYASFAWCADRPIELPAFRAIVETLPHGVLRAKGVLRFVERPDERAVFQLVGKRSSLEFEAVEPGQSSLVMIGPKATFDLPTVRGLVMSLGGYEVD